MSKTERAEVDTGIIIEPHLLERNKIKTPAINLIEINGQKIPDPKLHQRISFLKSAIRIAGYVLLPVDIVIASIVLVVSEVIGIIEELV